MSQHTTLNKIALLSHTSDPFPNPRTSQRFQDFFANSDIETRIFNDYAELMDSNFVPDCVIAVDAQEPKLGPYPTYGLINISLPILFSRKRFIRNLLTYDAYLTDSQFTKDVLNDLCFSTCKLGASTELFTFSTSDIYASKNINFADAKLCYIYSYNEPSHLLNVLLEKLSSKKQAEVYYFEHAEAEFRRIPGARTIFMGAEAIAIAYANAGIGLDLYHGNNVDGHISERLLDIISCGAIAITNYTEHVYKIFGDNILYLNEEDNIAQCVSKIESYIQWVRANPQLAKNNSSAAHSAYLKHFGREQMNKNLLSLHQEALHKQGYLAPADIDTNRLPWVSYIMRTGGKPEYITSALDSLAAQSYPNIQVILVLYKPLETLDEILKQYEPRLKFKIVEDFGGLRSTGIVTGMRNVDTEYFGMIDDDDPIHPNHVYSLFNTLRYNNKRDWRGEIKLAYAASYYFSETMQFPEAPWWMDDISKPTMRHRAVEHYIFYDPKRISSGQFFMMSNAWLAHRSLIDDELLSDPFTHSHEDIHFELQFALRTFFAFSCEITASHHIHGKNSTIVDVARNETDIFRHMLRLHYRLFPQARMYRTYKHGPDGNAIIPIQVPEGKMPVYMMPPTVLPVQSFSWLSAKYDRFMSYGRHYGFREAVKQSIWWVYLRTKNTLLRKILLTLYNKF